MKNKINFSLLNFFVILVVITAFLISNNIDNSRVINIFTYISYILIAMLILESILYAFIVNKNLKKDNQKFDELTSLKEYESLELYLKRNINKYIFKTLISNSNVLLVKACFLQGKNEEGYQILQNAKLFGKNKREIDFFEILVKIYINKCNEAKKMFETFDSYQNFKYDKEKRLIKLIFTEIDNSDYEYKFYNDSPYPIVKTIYDKYCYQDK